MRPRVNPSIQRCPTCGHMRVNHPGARLYECPVSKEVTAALHRFRVANGFQWRARLKKLWTLPEEERKLALDEHLLAAKDLIGPKRIMTITP